MNTIGLVAFALVGAAKAIREEFDLFGITVVGLATAFVGGVTRDILVNRVPLAFQSPIEISLGLIGVCVAVLLSVGLSAPDEHLFTIISDALGLAAFATTGAIVATEAGISAFGIIAIATINAVGGGAFADILLDRSPFILFDDFYASCAVFGGFSYWIVDSIGVIDGGAAVVCATVTVITRLVAVTQDWYIPTVQNLKSGNKK
mgnify:CR=1 FL=1